MPPKGRGRGNGGKRGRGRPAVKREEQALIPALAAADTDSKFGLNSDVFVRHHEKVKSVLSNPVFSDRRRAKMWGVCS